MTHLQRLKYKNLKDRYAMAMVNAERFSHNPSLVDKFLCDAIALERRLKEFTV